MGYSCAVRGVCGRQEARASARDAGSAQRRRAHEPTRPRPDNTRRAGDDARPGDAPAPHSPGHQALESALPRTAPPTDLAGDGVSTWPSALSRPRPPTGNPEATRGAAEGKDRAGPRAPGLDPNQAGAGGGGTWVAPTHLLQDAKERGPTRVHDPLSKLGHLWVGSPPRSCGTSGVMGPFLKRKSAPGFPSPSFGLLLLALLWVPPALCPPRGLLRVRILLTKPIPTP